ncbi:MAG: magnesium transporter [Firmicutes bacterium]|nr:magnesium transporter [Bacillota bacterium]
MNNELDELFENKKFSELKKRFEDMNEVDIAHFLETIRKDDVLFVKTFKLLHKDLAAEVFSELETETQQQLMELLTNNEVANLVKEMYVDDAVDFLEELPPNIIRRILKSTNQETRDNINKLLSYKDNEAGSIMTTEMVYFRRTQTVDEAFKAIREHGRDLETLSLFYVIDNNRKLEGVVSIRELMMAKPSDKLEDIMEKNAIFETTHSDCEEVANRLAEYGFEAMPIVDSEQKLVGIVTLDDVIKVVQQAATEDMQKMMAIRPIDKPYLKVSGWKHAKSRIVWLLVLSLAAIGTGAIIEGFEDALRYMPILMAFIPMLMDTGGNCGAQSSTVIVRGMALNEIKASDFFRVVWKELQVAFYCGLIVGAVNFIRIIIQYGGDQWGLGLVVWLGLWATMIISKMLGAALPTMAKRMKLDPAIMSAPLITTFADILGLLCFFGFAVWILQITI